MAIWRFQVAPTAGCDDPLGRQIVGTLADFGVTEVESVRTSRIYLVDLTGPTAAADARRVADELLTDPVIETCELSREGESLPTPPDALPIEVHLRPGVMDNVAASTMLALADLGIAAASVRTARQYALCPIPGDSDLARIPRLLGNDCIEEVIVGVKPIAPPPAAPARAFDLVHVAIRSLDDAGLESLSRTGHLFLSLAEMRTIRDHFQAAGRDPTDLELETLAQTWSEHCVHKTLKSAIEYRGAPFPGRTDPDEAETVVRYENLLRDTICRATDELMAEGRGPQCLSIFVDNAGVIGFDDDYGIAFKVETHNHPSAIEPYGGAATGTGGVVRDILGCGLGAKPVANTDVFCVAPPDWPIDRVPKGIIHPKAVLKGITAGVRDYGNRMGIPTVNGAVQFDPRYLGNPLVYCGCVGLIPRNRIEKAARPGDAIVLLGGRTGRDGIHGATFSSAGLTDTHEDEFAHAVQIGNAIEEKKVLDVILQARGGGRSGHGDAADCLMSGLTDCGAGGLSSAIGEMGEACGVDVHLDRVPLKYAGLRYPEIWISEAQERMVMAVPPENVEAFLALARGEDVEATVIGEFTDTGRLVVRHDDHVVGDLEMAFLHDGLPKARRSATWWPARKVEKQSAAPATRRCSPAGGTPVPQEWPSHAEQLKYRLSRPGTASKHWFVRQYDHEVQGGSVVKPLVGRHEGPSDAAVVRPRPGSDRGIALGCGMAPHLAAVDPYWMAIAAVDEAIRNVVCVGGDPDNTAILDNFCWPAVDNDEAMGALVRASQACYDAAKAYGVPFISGKDSLNNHFDMSAADAAMVREIIEGDGPFPHPPALPGEIAHTTPPQSRGMKGGECPADRGPCVEGDRVRGVGDGTTLSIPYTLLISAVSIIEDVSRCITSAPRLPSGTGAGRYEPGARGGRHEGGVIRLYYVGAASSCWEDIDLLQLARLHRTVADLIRRGVISAAHDVSDGGSAVAVAEMAIASRMDTTFSVSAMGDTAIPFAEGPSAYIVQASSREALVEVERIDGMTCEAIASMRSARADEPMFTFVAASPGDLDAGVGETPCRVPLQELRRAWRAPLDW